MKRGFTIICLCLLSCTVRAATYTSATASLSDVQTAVTSASNGDTVNVPAGTATWTGTLSIGTDIQLIGAGIGQTVITDGAGYGTALVSVGTVSNYLGRLSGFTFQGPGSSGHANTGAIELGGYCHTFRLDHCEFDNLDKYSIFTHDWVYGVIDDCVFSNCTSSIEVKMEGYGGQQNGDGSWADADSWGTTNAIYIENNIFFNTGGLDSCDGARVVFRNNYVLNQGVANHGTESSGRERSTRTYEIYGNTFNCPTNSGAHQSWAVYFRGGTGVVFSNLITGGIQKVALLAAYREWNSPWPAWGNVNPLNHWDSSAATFDSGHATSSGAVLTDSGKSWTPNQFAWSGYFLCNTNSGMAWAITANDATTITTEGGYHTIAGGTGVDSYFTSGDGYQIYYVNYILDQPGTGQGNLITGDTPLNSTTGTAVWPNEAADPIYIWGNTLNYQYPDAAYGPAVNGAVGQNIVVNGRGYVNGTAKPGYTPMVYPHPLVAGNPTPPTITPGGAPPWFW